MLLSAAALVLVSGCTVWRVRDAVELARLSEPLQATPSDVRMRLLIVGDSTAVGTGASSASESLAGLMARAFPHLQIQNRARDGATFADVATQFDGGGRFDMVLVQAGGNDVIRMRGLDAMRADIHRTAELARQHADLVVLMPAGNVGNAKFFFPPVSWLMTWRSRRLHGFVRDAAARHDAIYVNLFEERAQDPFVIRPGMHARDGLHPSDAGYRLWFDELLSQADLSRRLSRAA